MCSECLEVDLSLFPKRTKVARYRRCKSMTIGISTTASVNWHVCGPISDRTASKSRRMAHSLRIKGGDTRYEVDLPIPPGAQRPRTPSACAYVHRRPALALVLMSVPPRQPPADLLLRYCPRLQLLSFPEPPEVFDDLPYRSHANTRAPCLANSLCA